MSNPAPLSAHHLRPPRLLALTPLPVPPITLALPAPPLSIPWLKVLTTIVGAPSAIPDALWQVPLPAAPTDILAAIFAHLETRIPLLMWEHLYWEEGDEALEVFTHIPLGLHGFDCSDDFGAHGEATRFLATLDGLEVEPPLWFPPRDQIPTDLDLQRLLPALVRLREPLNGIAAIIAMLHHNTGTTLDACPSCYPMHMDEMLDWTEENLTWLEQDTHSAYTILKSAYRLDHWVEPKPVARLKRLWSAIRRAYRDLAKQPPPPRWQSFTISAEDFVAGRLPIPTAPKTLIELWALPTPEEDSLDPQPTDPPADDRAPPAAPHLPTPPPQSLHP